jgi:peptide/nickel transport system permease protein
MSTLPVASSLIDVQSGPPLAAPARRAGSSRVVRIPRSPKVIVGLVIVSVFVVLTVIGPWIAPYDPSATTFLPNLHPSGAHWLGTTSLGQDIFSQLLTGARATMVVGFAAGLLATLLSVVIGVTAGYVGGATDDGLSLVSNVFLAIPGLPLLIVIDSYLPSGDRSNSLLIGAIIALTGWAWGARVLRALTLSLRNRDFVEASRIVGESRVRIMLVEVVPNLIPVLAASFLFTVLYAIGAYVSLAYIGLTSTAVWNWGTMLYWAQANNAPLVNEWWWFVPPGVCIALVGTGLALLNFGIDEFINPRLRAAGVTGRAARRRGLPRRPILGLTPVVRAYSGADAGLASGSLPRGGGGRPRTRRDPRPSEPEVIG